MTLESYLRSHGITRLEFASRLGISFQAVSRYCRRERMPRPEIMQLIVQETDGAVTPNDFFADADAA